MQLLTRQSTNITCPTNTTRTVHPSVEHLAQ